jgi:acetylornithine deacetylase/succinyl-diaminopimelate desuccinylase-like protein
MKEFLRPWVDAHFDEECAFLAAMVRTPTDNPPGDCAAHARMAAQQLKVLGFEPEVHEVPSAAVTGAGMVSASNLVVRHPFGRPGPCIALNAHGDVVPPGGGWTHDPYAAGIAADATGAKRMYGRGVAVSKSDFATYTFALLALRALQAKQALLCGSVELHFTYDEEVGGDIGPKWLLAQGLTQPDLAIGAGFSYAVTTAHNGCLHVEVTLNGRQGHAAMPDSGIDALAAATQVLSALYASRDALKLRRSQITGIDHPTLNVGLISGGINTNVVPDQVVFRIDRRIIPEESPLEVEAELRAQLETAAAKCRGITIGIRRLLLASPLVPLPGAERLTQALRRNAAEALGVPVGEQGVPLYTDGRHYAAAGIPTVLYGAGPRTLGEANGHAADENLRLEDLRGATLAVAGALFDLLCAQEKVS